MKFLIKKLLYGNRAGANSNLVTLDVSTLFIVYVSIIGCPRNKQKLNFGLNPNKPKQDLFRVCFGLFRETKNKKISVGFGLFRCFEPILKQSKQTEMFLNKPKQPEIF
jgi:hypothetical protein